MGKQSDRAAGVPYELGQMQRGVFVPFDEKGDPFHVVTVGAGWAWGLTRNVPNGRQAAPSMRAVRFQPHLSDRAAIKADIE